MREDILYVRAVGKQKDRPKTKQTFPSIKRTDIMEGILSPSLDKATRSKLSNLYAEITYMEKRDLKYISEIAVSCQSDMDIYEALKKIKKSPSTNLPSSAHMCKQRKK